MAKFFSVLFLLLSAISAKNQTENRILQSSNAQLQAILENTSKIQILSADSYPSRLLYYEDQTIVIGILASTFQQIGFALTPTIATRNIQGTNAGDDFWPMTESQTGVTQTFRMAKFGTEQVGSVWYSSSTSPGSIIASIKTKTGDAIVDEFSVSPLFTTSLNHASPDILYLSNGNYVVSWIGPKASADANLTVSFKIYAGGTKTQIKSVDVLTLSAATSLNTRLVLLANNQFMLMFQHVTGGNIQINYQVFDNAGNSQGSIVSQGTSQINNAEACQLSDGKVAIGYANSGIYFKILDAANPGSAQTIQVDASASADTPGVAPLANGNVVITWSDSNALKVRGYKSDGTAIIATVDITPTGGVNSENPVPMQISGDNFLVGYRTISDSQFYLRKFFMGTSTLSYVGFTSNRDSQQNNVTTDVYSNHSSSFRTSSFTTKDIVMIAVVGGGPLIILAFIAYCVYKRGSSGSSASVIQVAPDPIVEQQQEEIQSLRVDSGKSSEKGQMASSSAISQINNAAAPEKIKVETKDILKNMYL